MKKRLVASLLAVILCFSLMPCGSMADSSKSDNLGMTIQQIVDNYNELGKDIVSDEEFVAECKVLGITFTDGENFQIKKVSDNEYYIYLDGEKGFLVDFSLKDSSVYFIDVKYESSSKVMNMNFYKMLYASAVLLSSAVDDSFDRSELFNQEIVPYVFGIKDSGAYTTGSLGLTTSYEAKITSDNDIQHYIFFITNPYDSIAYYHYCITVK